MHSTDRPGPIWLRPFGGLHVASHPVALLLAVLIVFAAGCTSDAADEALLDDQPTSSLDEGSQSSNGQAIASEDAASGSEAAVSDESSEDPQPSSSTDSSSAAASESESDAAAGESEPNAAPDESEPTWAVVLAGASSPGDELLETTVQDAALAGYEASTTNCDLGAAEALQMAPTDTYTVSIYFETEEAASAALDELEGKAIFGTVRQIRKSCPE